jgi:hypothetical protein
MAAPSVASAANPPNTEVAMGPMIPPRFSCRASMTGVGWSCISSAVGEATEREDKPAKMAASHQRERTIMSEISVDRNQKDCKKKMEQPRSAQRVLL